MTEDPAAMGKRHSKPKSREVEYLKNTTYCK